MYWQFGDCTIGKNKKWERRGVKLIKQCLREGCNKLFHVKSPNQLYCSPYCSKEAERDRTRERIRRHRRDLKKNIKTCKKCGNNVYYVKEEKIYWCVGCGIRFKGYNLRNVAFKGKKYKRICKCCNEPFYISEVEIRRGGGKFCSVKCKQRYNKGSQSPLWRGGKSFEPYCPNFNETVKDSVRSFFNNKCFLCGLHEKENDQKLSVHHVNYDKGQGCSGEWLLIPLCKSCHSKTNTNRKYWEEYFTNLLAQQNFKCGLEQTAKTCPICNERFIPSHRSIKYCSDACKLIAKKDSDEVARRKYHLRYRKNYNYLSSLLGSVVR